MGIPLTDPEKDGALQIHDIALIKTGLIKSNRILLRSTIVSGRAISVTAHEA
jgi:hypothetical protein